nr:hypothetical protein [uncultured bacterium]
MLEALTRPSAWIEHMLDNEDGTFSVMSHINCEWCDYCDDEKGLQGGERTIHKAKPDPYQNQRMED